MPNSFPRSDAATSDSSDYRHTFYGILNAEGQFWTPLAFDSAAKARAHLGGHAVSPDMLDTHRIVPVRVQLTQLPEADDER